MIAVRRTRAAAHRLLDVRLFLLLTLLVPILAACSPGSGGGPGGY